MAPSERAGSTVATTTRFFGLIRDRSALDLDPLATCMSGF